mmetsp:Transcript_8619/g.24548  ORF Transcript_8619/g.24548 Transcript_8619/m.24548 type:complete len:226 (+) Transcript_8619:79-756(+)
MHGHILVRKGSQEGSDLRKGGLALPSSTQGTADLRGMAPICGLSRVLSEKKHCDTGRPTRALTPQALCDTPSLATRAVLHFIIVVGVVVIIVLIVTFTTTTATATASTTATAVHDGLTSRPFNTHRRCHFVVKLEQLWQRIEVLGHPLLIVIVVIVAASVVKGVIDTSLQSLVASATDTLSDGRGRRLPIAVPCTPVPELPSWHLPLACGHGHRHDGHCHGNHRA